jgi:5'-phosphate synthase pdxT subunit
MVSGDAEVPGFALMDIAVVRNSYGRQIDSFVARADFAGRTISMPFIRAPGITGLGEGVEALSVLDGSVVAARQNNYLVTAFHPELTGDVTVHQYFLGMLDS